MSKKKNEVQNICHLPNFIARKQDVCVVPIFGKPKLGFEAPKHTHCSSIKQALTFFFFFKNTFLPLLLEQTRLIPLQYSISLPLHPHFLDHPQIHNITTLFESQTGNFNNIYSKYVLTLAMRLRVKRHLSQVNHVHWHQTFSHSARKRCLQCYHLQTWSVVEQGACKIKSTIHLLYWTKSHSQI